jgi:2-polyprenyl-3-methyl-5-hydroxy-6-metoxy-1,4-benzoquinol methylase
MRDEYYKFVRREIAPLLPAAAKRVLDVGAGVGATSRWLKARYPSASYIALEGNPDLVDDLRQNVDEAHIVDLNGPLPDVGDPDLVLFLDVLEHLLDPEKVLAELTRGIPADGTVIVSLPNVAHLSVSVPLLLSGSFEYRDAGILDRTHLRFFTRKSAVELVNNAGLTVTHGLRSGLFGPRSRMIDGLTFGAARDRLTKQYVMACRRTAATESQGDIRWGLAGLAANGAELDFTI